MSEIRYKELGEIFGCMECGVAVFDQKTHNRFHAILSHHGKTCALLKVAHITKDIHDKYDVYDKIGNPTDSWSHDAFEEVTGINPRPKGQ